MSEAPAPASPGRGAGPGKAAAEETGTAEARHGTAPPGGRYLAVLCLGALGVVFGDIGTSPLYALRECFGGERAMAVSRANVLGILSLIFWSLVLTISVKYLAVVLRADNRGEGGILVLMSLLRPTGQDERRRRFALVAMGLFGAALLYGDGIITPAITVLSAVEGLNVATKVFEPYILPITAGILIGLFLFQKRGTAGVGAVFGPVMLLWVAVLAVLGVWHVSRAPVVLLSMSPHHAVRFFHDHGTAGFLVLGSVFLAVTGGEALYADMGHFGARPIRLTWFALVLPSLLLNYFGQGALLLSQPSAADNPVFKMVPAWALYPMVGLATAASVIASQAVISGAFSLTRQAIQLGYMPRLKIEHTSAREIGQIYLPTINWLLMVSCIWLVFEFGSSSRLAAAYGVAVTSTMVITTVLLEVVARETWGVKAWLSLLLAGAFLVIDLAFFLANMVKVRHGGWFPLAVAALVYTLMTTWKTGREILRSRLAESRLAVALFLGDVERRNPTRVPGTAVFMDKSAIGVPPALLHNLKHNHVIHERVVFVSVVTDEVPWVRRRDRVKADKLGQGFHRVTVHYGFMQDPNVPAALRLLELDGKPVEPAKTTFFLGRETLIASDKPGMALWRERLFAWMSRSEGRATSFFQIPPDRVVELGLQVEL